MSGHYSIFTDAGCTEIAFKFSPDLGRIHCNSRKIDKVSRKSRETQIEGSNQLLHIKKLLQSLRLETTVLLLLLPWLWAEYCGQRLVIAPQCLLHPEPESGNSWEWLASLFSWRRKWQPTAVFLPGESCGQRILAGYTPQGCKESDMTEVTQHAYSYLAELFEGEWHVILILASSLALMQCLATELKLIRLIRHGDDGQKLQRDFLAFQEVNFSNNKNVLKVHG